MTELLGNQLLRSKRLYFDAPSEDDVDTYARWFSDIETLGYLWSGTIYPMTPEAQKARFERGKERGEYHFNVHLRENDRLIGNVMFKQIDWRSRKAEFGIAIGEKAYWGQGYGTEATQLMVRYGFFELNFNRIELRVASFNTRGIRSYEKAGFKHEVTRRQALYRNGAYHDVVIMSILAEEWYGGL